MPFFPQHALFPEATLYQILAHLDEEPTKINGCQPRHHRQAASAPTFTPRFDVVEVPTAYELYGELAGIEQQDISIEFTDAQTIVIKGKTERPQIHIEEAKGKEVETTSTEAKRLSATVEDEYDEADAPITTPASSTTSESTATATVPAAETQAPKPKYWVSERKVGEFARSFAFSQRIDHEAVQAGLKNGILRVVVPKSQKTVKVVVNIL